MLTVALVLGVACIVAAPLLFVCALIVRYKLGSRIESADPALWDQMKPGFYSDIRVSRRHRQRLKEFITTGECLELNDPVVTRLVYAYRLVSWALLIAVGAAALTVVAALTWG